MGERVAFETDDQSFEIYRHPDGTVTVHAEAEYGDSEMGFGTARTTLTLPPNRISELIEFLQSTTALEPVKMAEG